MKRRRRLGLVLLGAVALGLIVLAAHRNRPRALEPVRIWAGSAVTSRALFAEALARATGGTVDTSTDALRALADVSAGRLDAALVPGALPLSSLPNLRQVAVLQLEPLHFLVKGPLASAVERRLDTLRGKTVNLGPPGRTENRVARAVLAFVGLAERSESVPDGYIASTLDPRQLLEDADDDAPLPDGIFLIETLPSEIARRLVSERGYRLVGLPFAEAFALSAFPEELAARARADEHDTGTALHRGFVYDAVIPAYTYSVNPPEPAAPLHTLATRLLLVARAGFPAVSIERILDAVYGASFGGVMHPPLERKLLSLPPELPLHPGAVAFLRRDDPALTSATIDAAANVLSVGGALIGGGFFVWQLWRQRSRARREETFEAYLQKSAVVERRAAELELAAELDLEQLIQLQREVAHLKGEALDRFSAGELEGRELISGFLTYVNDVRDYIARLILHVREQLEQQAGNEGRGAQAIWEEAAGSAAEPLPSAVPVDEKSSRA